MGALHDPETLVAEPRKCLRRRHRISEKDRQRRLHTPTLPAVRFTTAVCDQSQSGRPDSNRRNLRVPNAALYQAELRPEAANCTQCMAVRTDELALLDLLEEAPPGAFASQIARVRALLEAGKMIPLHHRRFEPSAAVGARRVFEVAVPPGELLLPQALLCTPFLAPRSAVIGGIVGTATRLTPCLPPIGSREVEFRDLLDQLAPAATLLLPDHRENIRS